DAASLMQFRCDHMQTTELHDIGVETNIRSSAGHIGGNCDSALRSGSGDDLGFLGILPGVQQLMIKTTIGEKPAQPFRCLNRTRAHENRPADSMQLSNTLHYGVPLFVLRGVNAVGPASSFRRSVGGNGCRRQSVYAPQFSSNLACGTGHTGKPEIPAKQPLI